MYKFDRILGKPTYVPNSMSLPSKTAVGSLGRVKSIVVSKTAVVGPTHICGTDKENIRLNWETAIFPAIAMETEEYIFAGSS